MQHAAGIAKVTVRLAPGGTAYTRLKVTVTANYPASSCHPVTVHWPRISPPGQTAAGHVITPSARVLRRVRHC